MDIIEYALANPRSSDRYPDLRGIAMFFDYGSGEQACGCWSYRPPHLGPRSIKNIFDGFAPLVGGKPYAHASSYTTFINFDDSVRNPTIEIKPVFAHYGKYINPFNWFDSQWWRRYSEVTVEVQANAMDAYDCSR